MRTASTTNRILITGASQGTGRAAAEALARDGASVVLSARNGEALREVAAGITSAGGRDEVLVMDVTSDHSVDAAIATLLRDGPCDVVVNNAATCDQAGFLGQDVQLQRLEMEVNYWGALRVTRALLPAMQARRVGHIVNMSSLLGTIGAPSTANYGATKAALEVWSQALRGEVSDYGIDVTVVGVPHTDTEMGRRTRFDGVRSLPVDYTVKKLLRALRRRPATYAASPVYRMFLRLNGVLPRFMERQLARSARSALSPLTAPDAGYRT